MRTPAAEPRAREWPPYTEDARSAVGIERIGADDAARLHDWDAFVVGSARGHYAALSTWLASFRVYGFDFVVLALIGEAGIVGGMALLEYRRPGMCLVTCPMGPLLGEGAERWADVLLRGALEHARRRGAFLFQVQRPVAAEPGDTPCLLPRIDLPEAAAARAGFAFRSANAPNEMLWLAFPRGDGPELVEARLLAHVSARTRRSIRTAQRAGATVACATTEDDLAAGYRLVERNAHERGYAVRPWADLRATIVEQVARAQGVMLVARHDGRIVAANYSLIAGRRLSYISGGTLRTETNLGAGALVHWEAIRWAVSRGLDGYDLGGQGPPGVREFKLGFEPEIVRLAPPAHYVLAPARFYLFDRLYPWLRRHRTTVARLLRAR